MEEQDILGYVICVDANATDDNLNFAGEKNNRILWTQWINTRRVWFYTICIRKRRKNRNKGNRKAI